MSLAWMVWSLMSADVIFPAATAPVPRASVRAIAQRRSPPLVPEDALSLHDISSEFPEATPRGGSAPLPGRASPGRASLLPPSAADGTSASSTSDDRTVFLPSAHVAVWVHFQPAVRVHSNAEVRVFRVVRSRLVADRNRRKAPDPFGAGGYFPGPSPPHGGGTPEPVSP